MERKYRIVACPSFLNVAGDDNFALAIGSAGARVIQLKQALNILGASISEENFGNQTRSALINLGYPPSINDEATFNQIILRAYKVNKKLITLTEPELRALYAQEVSPDRRAKLTFDKWLKRKGIKIKVGQGLKAGADILFGWLKMKTVGVGNTTGTPNQAPVDTGGGGWFSKQDDGSIPVGYKALAAVVIFGIGVWGVSALVKYNKKTSIVSSSPIMN